MTQKHTPTPYEVSENNIHVWSGKTLVAIAVPSVGQIKEGRIGDNAAFIVRACNSHAALVEALEKMVDVAAAYGASENLPVFQIAFDALALAKGE